MHLDTYSAVSSVQPHLSEHTSQRPLGHDPAIFRNKTQRPETSAIARLPLLALPRNVVLLD